MRLLEGLAALDSSALFFKSKAADLPILYFWQIRFIAVRSVKRPFSVFVMPAAMNSWMIRLFCSSVRLGFFGLRPIITQESKLLQIEKWNNTNDRGGLTYLQRHSNRATNFYITIQTTFDLFCLLCILFEKEVFPMEI